MEKENGAKNIFSNLSGSKNHWFLTRHQAAALTETPTVYPVHRLNELDTNILENGNEIDSHTQSLKLEYLIKDREEQLLDINSKIKSAEISGDQQALFTHRAKKQRLENELREFKRQFATRDLNAKYPSNNGAKKIPFLGKMKRFVQRYFLAKVSKKVHELVQLSDSLEALQDLNSNVDELIKIKAPYGETIKNYERLTEYLSRANKIHSKISKTMKR